MKICFTNTLIGHGIDGKQKYQHKKPNAVVARDKEH
jgi:hypothetical protein